MSLKEAPSRRVSALLFIIIVSLVAIGLSLFQLYTSVSALNLFYQRGTHLALILILAFLLFPVFR